jgi:hypothetical protein
VSNLAGHHKDNESCECPSSSRQALGDKPSPQQNQLGHSVSASFNLMADAEFDWSLPQLHRHSVLIYRVLIGG